MAKLSPSYRIVIKTFKLPNIIPVCAKVLEGGRLGIDLNSIPTEEQEAVLLKALAHHNCPFSPYIEYRSWKDTPY